MGLSTAANDNEECYLDDRGAGSLIQAILRASRPEPPVQRIQGLLVGECLEEPPDLLPGRVRVRWRTPDGDPACAWLTCLRGLVVRVGDRVCVQQPGNYPEPLVTGVLDGLGSGLEAAPRREGAHLRLRADERLCIRGEQGQELLEVVQEPEGPVLRLLGPDLDLEVAGRLRLRAAEIELLARKGSVRLQATDDVSIQGEIINLN